MKKIILSAILLILLLSSPFAADYTRDSASGNLNASIPLSSYIRKDLDTNYWTWSGQLDWYNSADWSVDGSAWDTIGSGTGQCQGGTTDYCRYYFYDQTTCEAAGAGPQSDCYWYPQTSCEGTPAPYCSYGDESSCNSAFGCSWNDYSAYSGQPGMFYRRYNQNYVYANNHEDFTSIENSYLPNTYDYGITDGVSFIGDYWNLYGMNISGTLHVDNPGTWSFAIDSDDSSEIEVDGTIVASFYGGHGFCGCYDYNGTIDLAEGDHNVIVRQVDYYGEDGVFVYYKAPDDNEWVSFANTDITTNLDGTLTSYATASCGTNPYINCWDYSNDYSSCNTLGCYWYDYSYCEGTAYCDQTDSSRCSSLGCTWDDGYGISAYYKFDSNSSTLTDSAHGNDGSYMNGASTSTKGMWDSNALLLDGSDDYACIVNTGELAFNSGMSASAWIKMDSYSTTGDSPIVGRGSGSYYFTVDPSGYPRVYIYYGFYDWMTANAQIPLGKWTHVAFTYNGFETRIYINGIDVGTNYSADSMKYWIGDNGYYIMLGAISLGGDCSSVEVNRFFDGAIDEVKLYDRALTASEVFSDYNLLAPSQTLFVSDTNSILSEDPISYRTWNSIKINSDLNYNYGAEITPGESFFDQNLVGLWHLNNDANDSSGNSHNGTWGGSAFYTSGLWDTNAGSFNGSNNYISVASSSILRPSQLTISSWVKMESYVNNTFFVSYGHSGSNGFHVGLYDGGGNNTFVWFFGGSGPLAYSTTIPEPNKWYNVVTTYDGSNLKIYVNGSLESTAPHPAYVTPTTNFIIGCLGQGGNCFRGQVEEVAIWNKALTTEQIKDLYRKGVSQIDLNVYTCADSACLNKTSSQYLTNIKNNYATTLSGLEKSYWLGYDAYFKPAQGMEANESYSFWVGPQLRSVTSSSILGHNAPVLTINSIDGYSHSTGRNFSHIQDGLVRVDFNVIDLDNNDLNVTLRYGTNTVENAGTVILNNVSLRASGYCDDTNFADSTHCAYDINTLAMTDGNYYIKFKIIDAYHAFEYKNTGARFAFDNTAPVFSVTQSQGWTRGEATFSINCTDALVGCGEKLYRINSGGWRTYSSQAGIKPDGNYTVDINIVDTKGNYAAIQTITLLTGFDGMLSTYDDSNNIEAFFGNRERVVLVYDVNLAVVPRITVVDSLGVTQVASVLMSNISSTGAFGSNDLNTYYYAFDINGAYGWFDVNIENQRFENAFYYARSWASKTIDADGNSFPFTFNIDVNEPNNVSRLFGVIDKQIDFAPNANPNSVRVLDYNGDTYIEIPSKLYKIIYDDSNLCDSANLVFLSSFSKGEARQFTVSYSVVRRDKNYGSDANTQRSASQLFFENSEMRFLFNDANGAFIKQITSKQAPNYDFNTPALMQQAPVIVASSSYDLSLDTAPTVSVESNELVSFASVLGTITSFSQDTNYLAYAKNPYVIIDTNVRYNLVGEVADSMLFDIYLITDTNRFASYAAYNGSFTLGQLARGGDSTSFTDYNAFGLFDQRTAAGMGLVFLSSKAFQTIQNNTSIIDSQATTEIWNTPHSGSITSSDYFNLRYALLAFNSVKGISDLNSQIITLKNPLLISVGVTSTEDSSSPVVTTDANYSPFTPLDLNDTMDINCFAGFSDDILVKSILLNVLGPRTDLNITETFNSQNAFMDYIVADANLNAGDYNCTFTAYDLADNNATTFASFTTTDTSAPSILVSSSPDSNAGIDPDMNVLITATVTEYSDLNYVRLFYSNDSNLSDANVSDMNCTRANYVSFCDANIWAGEGTYYYLVSASDGNYDSNTQIYHFYSYTDYTWTNDTTSLGLTTITPLSTRGTIGSFTLQNTGDTTLSFTIRSDWDNKYQIWFNEEPETALGYSITLDINESLLVTTKVTSKTTDRSDALTITITPSNAGANPSSSQVTGTVVSVSDGPFLLLTMDTASTAVTRGQDANYTATLTNAGTADATNVVLDWNYPLTWALKSGTKTTPAFSLSRTSSVSSTIFLTVPLDANLGLQTIKIIATCCSDSSRTQILSTGTTVFAQAEDDDDGLIGPGTPGGTGGASSGGGLPFGSASQRDMFFQTNEFFELVRGQDDSFKIKFTNPLSVKLIDLNLSVSGIAASYLKLKNTNISELDSNREFETEIEITSPKYFSPGEYAIIFEIKGYFVNTNGMRTSFEEKRIILLFVHDTTKEAAAGYITEIQNFMNDLNSQNLKLAELPDLLRESKKLFGKNDFDGVKKNYDSAKKIFDEAIESLRKSRSVSGLVALASSGGLLTPGTDRLLLLAQLALARGDYALALERLREAELTYALETKGEFNLFIWVLGNLDRVFVMLVLFVLAVYLFYLGVSLLRINSGLRELNSENSLLLGLIASLQRKSFVENKMSLGEYYDSLGQFERRISEVSEHIIELTTKKNNLFAFTSSVTRLGEEKKSLLELIRDTQKQYFNLGLIETRIYSARTGSLTKRLSEVEEQLVTNDLKKTIRLNTRGAQKYFWKAYYKIFR